MNALLQSALKTPPRTRMSLEDFLAWVDEDIRAEWVKGEVQPMVAARISPHNLLQSFLFTLLRLWVEFRDAGLVLSESFLYLPQVPSLRVPDVMVVRREHLARVGETYVEGPADLVVEVVSPESVRRDYGEKGREYEAAGVPEYWIVDPGHRVLTVLVLEEGGYGVLFEGQEGKVASRVLPGFWLRAEWLWQEPLPRVREVMLEIGGEAYVRDLLARLRPRGGEEG